MKKAVVIIAVIAGAILAIGGFLVGSYQGSVNLFSSDRSSPDEVQCPTWMNGQFWHYAFETPDIKPTMARVVVATSNDTNYQLGIENRLDAQKHAVLNYNPMLGRITTETLGVYENGIVQPILKFPLEKGETWKFSFLGREEWEAKVTSIVRNTLIDDGKAVNVNIEAKTSSGDVLSYVYGSDVGWLRSMVLTNAQGEEELSMVMVSHGTGFTGEVFFFRGVDLYDEVYSSSTGSPVIDIYDSFIDRGHAKWGPFDSLIYYYEVEVGSQSNGLLTIRDHSTNAVLRKTYDPGTTENGMGSIPSSGGEVGIVIGLQGTCDLHLMIAGGIEYKWTL